jgi:hypothetical protein
MMVRLMDDELWKDTVVVEWKNYPEIFLEGLRKTTKAPVAIVGIPSRDPNRAPSEYMSRALTLQYSAYNRSKPNTLFLSFGLFQ